MAKVWKSRIGSNIYFCLGQSAIKVGLGWGSKYHHVENLPFYHSGVISESKKGNTVGIQILNIQNLYSYAYPIKSCWVFRSSEY